MDQDFHSQIGDTTKRSLHKIGFWASMVALIGAVGYSVVQILQIVEVLRFPWDEITIYGFSLLIAVPFVLAMLALHYLVPEGKKYWSHAAVLMAVIYTVYVSFNYVVQLTSVIPKQLQGPLGEFSVLKQTPHSLFWDADALGYIFMGLSTLFAVPVFEKAGLERWVRRFFLANGLFIPVYCVVYFSPSFSTPLLLLGLTWVVAVPGSLLLLMMFFLKKLSNQ